MSAIMRDAENGYRNRWKELKRFRGYKMPRERADACPGEVWSSERSRHRLRGYAESFRKLARSLQQGEAEAAASGTDPGTPGDAEQLSRMMLLERQQLRESKLMLGSNLEEMAGILEQLSGDVAACRPVEARYRRLIWHAFRSESIFAEAINYLEGTGTERQAIGIRLRTEQARKIPAEEIADMLSVLLRRPFIASSASPAAVDGETRQFEFLEEPRYIALTGFCKVTKENETVSGDNYSVVETEQGRVMLLLSDGTGSGERANRDSELVLDLVEQFLETGYGPEAAVRMVNTAIYARGREPAHPTLDVCEINLCDGSCAFLKAGGAASYLKHGAAVEQIDGAGMPLGLLRTPMAQGGQKAETTRHTLCSGDYVILVTDGVLDALEDEDWTEQIRRITAELEDAAPSEIAEAIIRTALCTAGGHVRDDMTVLVGGMWEREGSC